MRISLKEIFMGLTLIKEIIAYFRKKKPAIKGEAPEEKTEDKKDGDSEI